MRFFLLILKNLRRNRLRSLLTTLAVVALVAVFSMIVNVLGFLDELTTEKDKDVRMLISDRFRLMSGLDRRYVEQIVHPGSSLHQELRQVPGFRPEKYTVWHFVVFSIDPELKDRDKSFFALAT